MLLCYFVVGQVCDVIVLLVRFVMLLLLLEGNTSNSYHLHTFEMTKLNKTLKEKTPKTTNHLHTQEKTKGSKISRKRKQ
jgi:hypothetical protein